MRDLGMNGVRRGTGLRTIVPAKDGDRAGDLVMTPLRIALWDRDRRGRPVKPGQLLHYSDAGSQYT
jgi:hypothetical protein